jgi:glycosyltransferase involved in cell wall biosynthesis
MGYSLIKKYQCGVELESGSPEDLAQAILEIKNMPTEEYELLGENAKKGAENFDFKILTEKLIDVIDNVV